MTHPHSRLMKTVKTFSCNPSFSAISNLHLSSPVHITTLRPFRIKARAPSFKPSPAQEERAGRKTGGGREAESRGQGGREEGIGRQRGGGREAERRGQGGREEGVGRQRGGDRETERRGQGEREEGAGRQRGGGREAERRG